MRILMTHGYLLTGTGSNLYVANLARQLVLAGHEVTLVCQDPAPEGLDFVGEVHQGEGGNGRFRRVAEGSGNCRVFRPDLAGLLPVYVFDRYEGFTVKTFLDCSDEEIERYAALNRQALRTILEAWPADVIQTNHSILFPHIVAALGDHPPHVATVHGSALNFCVKEDRRFVPPALEGFEDAAAIVVDSRHADDELREFLTEEGRRDLEARVRLIPAGVDVERFRPIEGDRAPRVTAYLERIGRQADGSRGRRPEQTAAILARPDAGTLASIADAYDAKQVDTDVVAKIDGIDWETERVVLFLGKYLWTKGLHLILTAAPHVLRACPDTRFVFVGFGTFREPAEHIWSCLIHRRLDLLKTFLDGHEELRDLRQGIETHEAALREALDETHGRLREAVVFTGIASHDELQDLLPAADLLVAPSVFPEAFGMVAVEALASGVFPVVTDQSAFAEIAAIIAEDLEAFGVPRSYPKLGPDAFVELAGSIIEVLALLRRLEAEGQTAAFKRAMREVAASRFSWSGISIQYQELYKNID